MPKDKIKFSKQKTEKLTGLTKEIFCIDESSKFNMSKIKKLRVKTNLKYWLFDDKNNNYCLIEKTTPITVFDFNAFKEWNQNLNELILGKHYGKKQN